MIITKKSIETFVVKNSDYYYEVFEKNSTREMVLETGLQPFGLAGLLVSQNVSIRGFDLSIRVWARLDFWKICDEYFFLFGAFSWDDFLISAFFGILLFGAMENRLYFYFFF